MRAKVNASNFTRNGPAAASRRRDGVQTNCAECGWTATYRTRPQADAYRARHSCGTHRRRADQARRRADAAAARPIRDCEHTALCHQHGTRAAYVSDRCRCEPCTAANRSDERSRQKAIAYGRWNPYREAEPVRQHVRALMAAGIGLRRIAELARLPYGTVASLVYGSPRSGRTPSGRIRPHTATQLLAITATTEARAPGALIDATGTRLRLQSLVLNGWSLAGLARRLGRSPDHLPSALKAAAVTIATSQAVRALFDELWDTAPPTRTHTERITATKARNRAARQGWLPAMAWDDMDDGTQPPRPGIDSGCSTDIDEIAVERAMDGDHVRLTVAERDEAVRRLTSKGYSVRQIAEYLGTTTRTVMRRRAADRAARLRASNREASRSTYTGDCRDTVRPTRLETGGL